MRLFLALLATAIAAFGADRLVLNLGTSANDGTGDTLRTFGQKVQTNFITLFGWNTNLEANLTAVSNTVNGITGGTVGDATEDWTLVLVPDTQYLTAATHDAMGDWIVANETALNIKLVIGVGDVTDDGSIDAQWNASTNLFYQSKAASISTIVAIGNHDNDSGAGDVPSDRGSVEFNERYGTSWLSEQTGIASSTYYASGHAENAAHFVSLGGDTWLILVLEFGPRDAVLTWANAIMDAHPTNRTIVVSHAYLLPDGTRDGQTHQDTYNPHNYSGIASDCNDGQEIWLASLRDRPQVELVVNGHYLTPGAGQGRQMSIGTAGNIVHELYSNYQDYGSTYGALRVMQFQNSNTRVNVRTYATSAGYLTGDRDVFSLDLKQPSPATTLERRVSVGQISPAESGLEDGLIFWAPFSDAGVSNTLDVVSGDLGTFRGTNYPTRGSSDGIRGRYLKGNDSGSVVFPWNYRYNGMTGLTVSAWVRMTNDTDGGIFASVQGGGTSGTFYLASLTNNAIRLTLIDDDSNRYDSDIAHTGLYDSAWHNVVGTWDGGTSRVYVDGKLAGSSASASGYLKTYQSAALVIGDYSGNAGTWDTNYIVGGDIDEVRVWSRALTASEVLRVAGVADWNFLVNMPAGFADGQDDEGAAGADASAIHDDTAGEIAAVADKASAAAGDHLLIEDSADSNNKKDLLVSGLESALEGVLDLQDMQGAVTDDQVPNSVTIDQATLALTGDSATGFFGAGQVEQSRGGTGVDSSAFGAGLLGSTGAGIIDIDTEAELETALGGINLLKSGDNIGAATATDEAYNATTWDGSLGVPTKNAIRDKIESMGSGGAALAGTVIGSGTPTAYALPRYSNTTGTNIEPTTVSIDAGVMTGVKSIAYGQGIPNIISLGTISGGSTATLLQTNNQYSATFSGSTATIALPASPSDGVWVVHGTTTYGSGVQVITIPSLIRPELDFDTAITTITNAASSSGKFTIQFTARGGAFDKVSVVGDSYSPAGGGGGTVSDSVASTSWDGSTTAAPSQNAVYDEFGRQFVSVFWHGAIGDGTDETAEVKAAYNSINKTLGGTLYFPPGKYKFNLQVTNKNITILGSGGFRDESGAVTNYFAAADATLPVIQVGDGTNSAHGWHIKNATFYGLTGANPDDVGVRLAGGAQEGSMENSVVWRFDTNIWVEATGTLPTEINTFRNVIVRMASGVNDSRGFQIAMPPSSSGTFYTEATTLDQCRVICGQVNSTNHIGLAFGSTGVVDFGSYFDCNGYGHCALSYSVAGSSTEPTFAGFKTRFDDSGSVASNWIIWVSNKSTKAGIMEVFTGRIMMSDGYIYGDGSAGEVTMGEGTFDLHGYYAKLLYPEIQDTVAFTLQNDAAYTGINYSHMMGRQTTNLAIGTTGDLLLNATNGITKIRGSAALSTDNTYALTNKTFDAATTGNVLKQTKYADLTHPHLCDGTGAIISTNAYNVRNWGHATFSGSQETNANYVEYIWAVPADIDTAVDLTATLKVVTAGTDADQAEFRIKMADVADSADASTTTFSNPIQLQVTPSSPAANDVFTFGPTTLTSWRSSVTAGDLLIIRLERYNNNNDDALTDRILRIAYGSTQ